MHRSNLPPWKTKLLLGYIFTVLGGSFLLASVGIVIYESYFLKASSPAMGVVVANIESRSQMDSDLKGGTSTVIITFCPQFRYTTPDGIERTSISHACTSPPQYNIGQQIPVRYLQSNPANAQIDSFSQKWVLPLVFGILSFLFLPVGSVLLWITKRNGFSLDPLTFWDSETTTTRSA